MATTKQKRTLEPAPGPAPLSRPGSAATLERLREMILSGELAPGSVVSQLTLARSLGISTTPLREIIRELQLEGLMEMELNRRPRVKPLDIDDLDGVYAGRILFESLAISLTVPHLSADDVEALDKDVEDMHRTAVKGEHARWAIIHLNFHRRLITEAPSPMASSIANLVDRSERYRRLMARPGLPRGLEEADRDHRRIAIACSQGDAQLAARELGNHLAQTALSLCAMFAPDVEPRAVRQAIRMVNGTQSAGTGSAQKRIRVAR